MPKYKTIIHCQALQQVLHVYTYFFAICPSEYNEETIHLIKTDSCFRMIIATVAFSNELNAKTLLDSQVHAACLEMIE